VLSVIEPDVALHPKHVPIHATLKTTQTDTSSNTATDTSTDTSTNTSVVIDSKLVDGLWVYSNSGCSPAADHENGKWSFKVASMVNEEVAKNTTFNSIKNNVLWLEKYNDKEYSLNIIKYKQEQKQLKDVVKNLDNLNKLTTPMDFRNLTADTAAINSAEDKIEKNKQWIKFRNTDVYIDESVKALDKLIALENLAKNK
jgi:hypothetical protein